MKISAEVKQLINEGMPAMVATAGSSGKPNVSAKGSAKVLDDEHLYFADTNSARTSANLRENPQIAMIFFNPTNRKGVRIWGKAEVLDSGPLFEEVSKDVLARRKAKVNYVIRITAEDLATF